MNDKKLTAATLRGHRDLLSVKDIQYILNIGRTSAYKLLKSGKIKSLRICAKYRIPKAYLIDFLNEKT